MNQSKSRIDRIENLKKSVDLLEQISERNPRETLTLRKVQSNITESILLFEQMGFEFDEILNTFRELAFYREIYDKVMKA